jgi:Uma2 family endonuclease
MSATATPTAPASTTTPPPAPAKPYYLSQSTLRRFTLAEYHRMIETGILIDGEPYELLEGWIVRKMSRGNPHDSSIMALTKRLVRMMPAGWDVRAQCAITLTDDSEPEPDFALVRGDESTYRDHHPGPTEIGVLIEVAASSLAVDRYDKGRIYARDRIPAYWVVNVVDRQIEMYTQPGGPADAPAYQQRQDFLPGSAVPVVLDGQTVGTIAVSDVLG